MDVNHDALADSEDKLAPTLTLPKFATRGWVEANIGNVQASDIRHISEKCQKIIAEWPAKKLDHEEFLDQVHRCLRLPNGISILNGALHSKAARKRPLFGPVVERVVAFLQNSDKADDWNEIRKLPPTQVAEDVASILRDYNQLQLLQEIIFVDLERGLLSPDSIPWVHDTPGLEELSQFVKAVGNSETNSEAEDNDSAATGGAHYTSDEEEQGVSQMTTIEQVAGAWTKGLERLRFALNAANRMPDIEVAETIVSAGQNLMQVAARHRDLATDSSLEIEQAFKQLIELIQNDRRISEVIDPTFIDGSSDALCTQVFNVEEIKQILEYIAGITVCTEQWSAERDTYDQAERAYLAAAVTQRTELSSPMQESLARLNSIKSECNLIVQRIKTFIETEKHTPRNVEPRITDEKTDSEVNRPAFDSEVLEPEPESPRDTMAEDRNVISEAPTIRPPSLPDIAVHGWNAVTLLSQKGRHALASFVARTLADTYPTSVTRLNPDVYHLVALATAAQEIVDVPPEPFRDCCGLLLSQLPELAWNASGEDRTILLYLLSGTLFPSLFIPASAARSLVKQSLVGRFGSAAPLHRLIEHISEADHYGAALVPAALSKSDQQIFWQRRLEDLQATARGWKDNEEIYHGFGNFRPAEVAWSAMIDPNRGAIGKVMRVFAETGQRAATTVREAAERLQNVTIEELLDDSGTPRLSQRHIEGRARNNLRHNVEASLVFLERCLRHLQRAPDSTRQGAPTTGLDRFTTMLRERITHARQFLQQQQPASAAEKAALSAARGAVTHVQTMFDKYEPPKLDISLDRWFGREFLLIPGLRFSGGWDPDPADSQILLEGAISLSMDCPETLFDALEHAFQSHLRAGAHVPTGRIITELELLGLSKAELALRHTAREADIRELRRELSSLQVETRDRINMAMALNLIDDVEKRALETRVRGIEVDHIPLMDLKAEDILIEDRGRGHVAADFPTAREILSGIERQLDERFEVARSQLKKEVDQLSLDGIAKPSAVERVNNLLGSRDIVTANEYLRLLKDGQDLPLEGHQNPILHDFMHVFLPKLEQNFSTNRQMIIDVALDVLAQNSASIPGLFEIEDRSAAERDDATRMLLAWRDIRSSTSELGGAIERLFAGGLSFDVKRVEDQREKGGRIFRFHLATARLVVPDGFVVPLFGSEANGNYLVEVIRGQPKTVELFQQMQGDPARQRATFHLFAGMLGTADRADLADRAHNRGYQGVVIDDALIAYLAFVKSSRLAALFRIASAFIKHNPYHEVTPLPPEMFYGRAEQRSQIISRRGGSLVFGGRRLGKSSLLRDVERKEHRPTEGVFMKCIDIHDIGQTDGYGARFWQRLANELRTAGVNISKGSTLADAVVTDVRKFLGENTSRRLVLMLDEADNFLAAEEENKYDNVVRLRQIVEETEGRFKVVMAGLHNVQRTATKPNQSLGHFGSPVCIGPFVGNDRHEGLRLVTEPLATLGFEFETSTLPLRILSQTNYYPALVQLYCRELLNHLFKVNKQDQNGPPFRISSADLEAAYKSQHLSEEINKRFRLTLDLDDRYKLITLVIANTATEQSKLGTVAPPMKPEEVGRQCLMWCPALFENKTPSAFLALLEELVGLGVLSQQGRDGFVLRSPNIVTMLGSTDTISEELLHFDTREPLGLDRSAQRRVLDAQHGVPSPLTPAQEHRLLETDFGRVAIILASIATGLESVEKAIQSISQKVFNCNLELARVRSPDELLRRFGSRGRESASESRIVLVPPDSNWNVPWVRRVSAVSADLAKRHIRIMFVGGPTQARTVADDRALAEEIDIESAELWTETVLRSYLSDRERKDCDLPELRQRMLDASGRTGEGVRCLLNAMGNRGEKFDDAASAALKELGRRSGLASNFGIGSDLEPIYVAISRWAPCSDNDVKTIVDDEFSGVTPISIEGIIRYGIWMGALFRDQELKIDANPLLKSLFDQHSP